MSNLMDLLQSQLSGQLMDQIGSQLGGSKEQNTTAVNGVMSAILGGMAKNVSSPQGANALLGALDKDHDGSVLDDIMGLVTGGGAQSANSRATNGAGILKHVLGGKQSSVVDAVSKSTGLDSGKIGSLMVSMAPMIMGLLGKQKKENNLDAGGLADLVKMGSSLLNKSNSSSGIGSILTGILDKDGDGSIVDDIAQSGFKSLLGRLFRRK